MPNNHEKHWCIADTALIHAGVEWGEAAQVDDYCLIGVPARGRKVGEVPTVLGSGVLLRSHSVIYAGTRIGRNFQCGHACLIREDCEIGAEVSVGSHTVLEFQVRIADGVRIHSQAFVPECSVLEEGCWIGPNVVLTNAKFPASRDAKDHLTGVKVGRWARIGANATILPGVYLGEGCLVGAGSVVTKDVPAGAVVVGNPARVIKAIGDLRYQSANDTTGMQAYEFGALRTAG